MAGDTGSRPSKDYKTACNTPGDAKLTLRKATVLVLVKLVLLNDISLPTDVLSRGRKDGSLSLDVLEISALEPAG